MLSRVGQNEAALIGITARNLRPRPLHDDTVEGADVHLRYRYLAIGNLTHPADRLEMVDRLEVILKRLAATGDALFDDQRRLGRTERVPLDRVRRIGQFEIVVVLEIAQPVGCQRAEPVELGLFCRDLLQELVHDLFLSWGRPQLNISARDFRNGNAHGDPWP